MKYKKIIHYTKNALIFFKSNSTYPNVDGAGFYAADSSQLNRREKTGAFDDAF